ncbi:unnamed protein product [Effrenium voratum]|nr:unnamed protein product [Effrenium voratum]
MPAQPNNAANIMMKNLLDLCIGVLVFFLFGYSIAYGDAYDVGCADAGVDVSHWFISFSYATTAATINSGALAGRVAFFPYLLLSSVMTGLVYPVSARLVWGDGWLAQIGFVDFAGSATVHLVGAVSALVSTCLVGPRIGRFAEYRAWRKPWAWLVAEKHDDKYYRVPEDPVEKKVHVPFRRCRHPVQLLFGTFLLLVGFLAFNPASTLSTTNGQDLVVAHASATTLLAAAGAGIGGMLFSMVRTRSSVVRVPELTNALIGGLVASCACCSVIPLSVAPLVGCVAALLTLLVEELLVALQVDDAVGAVAAHGPSGVWGVLCVSLFSDEFCGGNSTFKGIFFGGGKAAWEHLGVQMLGALVLSTLAFFSTYVVVMLTDCVFGFRCSRACELIGLDFWEHHFDDGSLHTNRDKAKLWELSQMRLDLSRRTTSLDNLVPQKWCRRHRTRGKDASEATTASETPRTPRTPRSPQAEILVQEAQSTVFQLEAKVADLEQKLSLLALGMMRDGQTSSTDVCGTRKMTSEDSKEEL